MRRTALLAAAGLALAGCTANTTADTTAEAAGPIAVAASDTACDVATVEASTGAISFEVTNNGSETTEFYFYAEGDRVLGEVENIAPGLSRRLLVEVPDAGTYTTSCRPGMAGEGIRADFAVTGESVRSVDTDERLAGATDEYARYVAGQSETLAARTGEFVDAVRAGDVEGAKALFPIARTYWERIEPVAESFGDLDPKIDGREDLIAEGVAFTGYHRLERDLWQDGLQPDSAEIADALLADVQEVVDLAADVELTPVQLANGAKELLDEVATGKITGEEDRYSHTDLWDFRANVDGSAAAIAALRPVLAERDPELVDTLDARFAAVDAALEVHRSSDGFVPYTELTTDEIRELAQVVDALAEPLSQVAGVVVEP